MNVENFDAIILKAGHGPIITNEVLDKIKPILYIRLVWLVKSTVMGNLKPYKGYSENFF